MRLAYVARGLCGLLLLAASHATAAEDELARRFDALDARLAGIEAKLQNQGLLTLSNEVQGLKAELGRIRGELEVQSHQLRETQKRQQDLYADLDMRLTALAKVMTAPPAPAAQVRPPAAAADTAAPPPATAPSPSAAPVATDESITREQLAESRAYETALNQFKIGNYQGAIAAFRGFVKVYPKSPLAPSAQYWIGNAFFADRDYKAAMAHQRKLIATYPDSPKVPDAMLNIASCQQELNDPDKARRTLEDLVEKYPVSAAADTARRRLQTLK
jgi:tol-pal system protein YbgF